MRQLIHLSIFPLLLTMLWGCVNEINSEDNDSDEVVVEESETPITFTSKVNSTTASANVAAGTRVTSNAFDDGDQVGLFAMIKGTELSGKRYIDNLMLTAASDGTLTPEKTVYYPEGDYNLDFIAYYPYDTNGVDEGSSTISVAVETDQSTADGLSQSDFLTAEVEDVAQSEEAVTLAFSHRMARVKVELVPSDGDVDGLLEDNPQISASGFYTSANFNLETGTFSSLANQANSLALGGSWEAGTDRLTGMEMIVVPQTVTEGEQALTLEWNGKVYNCALTSCTLTAGTQRTVTVTATESASEDLDSFVGSLEDWTDDEDQTSSSESSSSYVQVSTLSYTASNVYRVYTGGYAVAEICREYLNNTDISSRAVVVYPVVDDETDLSNGTVLELVDVDGDVCGGTVEWTDDYEFTYTAGTSATIARLYIDSEGDIAITQPETCAEVSVSSLMLKDSRSATVQQYAICKTGRQYWMGENLTATMYSDGTELELLEEIAGTAAYFMSDDEVYYYYSGEAVEEGDLAPEGWRIPTSDDWTNLVTYAGGTAALKTGTWAASKVVGSTVTDVTNLTYLALTPAGQFLPTLINRGKYVSYWIVDEEGNIPSTVPVILGDSDDIYWVDPVYSASAGDYYKGMSLRCVRE